MYMRLWWKDARQFWPIWAFLAAGRGRDAAPGAPLREPRVPMRTSSARSRWAGRSCTPSRSARRRSPASARPARSGCSTCSPPRARSSGRARSPSRSSPRRRWPSSCWPWPRSMRPLDLSPWRMRFGGGPLEAAALMLQGAGVGAVLLGGPQQRPVRGGGRDPADGGRPVVAGEPVPRPCRGADRGAHAHAGAPRRLADRASPGAGVRPATVGWACGSGRPSR